MQFFTDGTRSKKLIKKCKLLQPGNLQSIPSSSEWRGEGRGWEMNVGRRRKVKITTNRVGKTSQ